MRTPRLQLFELEDQAWFTALLRDLATDYLRFVEHRFGLRRHALPVLDGALSEAGVDRRAGSDHLPRRVADPAFFFGFAAGSSRTVIRTSSLSHSRSSNWSPIRKLGFASG